MLSVIEEGRGLLQDQLQLHQLTEAARQPLCIGIHLQQLLLQLLQLHLSMSNTRLATPTSQHC